MKLDAGISIEEALKLVASKCDFALHRHVYFVATAMREIAQITGNDNDSEFWFICGLLHDIDWNETINNPEEHCGKNTVDFLRSNNVNDEVIQTVLSHYPAKGVPLNSLHRKALFACDELSGFIVASALVRPTKMIGISPESVIKKMKDKAFARQVNRDDMKSCETLLDIPLKQMISYLIPPFELIAPDWELA